MTSYFGAICRSGHVVDFYVTDHARRIGYNPTTYTSCPIDNFCADCGSAVLLYCPSCSQPLPGFRGAFGVPEADEFCRQCGAAFPWTSRQSLAARLRDPLANEQLDAHDRMEAQEALDTLTADDTSDAAKKRAVGRLKQLASAAWWGVANPVLVSVLSAEVRKQTGLPPG